MGASSPGPLAAPVQQPPAGNGGPAPSPAAVSQSLAAPASGGSPKGLRSTKLQRLEETTGRHSFSRRPSWRRQGAAGLAEGPGEADLGTGPELDAADTSRCRALLPMPDSSEALAGQALSPGAAPFEPAEGVLCSPAAACSLTVDIGAAQDSLPGSASVNQPSRRRSWGLPVSPAVRSSHWPYAATLVQQVGSGRRAAADRYRPVRPQPPAYTHTHVCGLPRAGSHALQTLSQTGPTLPWASGRAQTTSASMQTQAPRVRLQTLAAPATSPPAASPSHLAAPTTPPLRVPLLPPFRARCCCQLLPRASCCQVPAAAWAAAPAG